MKKLVFVGLVAASAFAPQAFSQAQNFEGVSVQLSTGYQDFSLKPKDIRVEPTSYVIDARTTSKSGVPVVLSAAYTAALGNAFTLGAVVDYFPITSQVGLSVVPGYALTEKTQGYVKLGWAYVSTTLEPGNGLEKVNSYLNGPTAGIGVKTLFTENLYGFAEFNYIAYQTATFSSGGQSVTVNGKTNNQAYNFLLGVGYKF
jgi:outer membrane immunogenic protein